MVLPAPAPHDAPGEGGKDRAESAAIRVDDDFIPRIQLSLQLTHAGLLQLVDRGSPARLGELVRALLPSCPDLEVRTSVLELASLPRGTTLVLAPRATDADWLNIQRPMFSRLALRVILWCDAATTLALHHNAFDFFDWISHRYICPLAAAPHGVAGIRCALAARSPGIVWTGGDLDACFRAARPSRALARVSAARPYAELVDAVKQAGAAWVVWTDVDGPFRLRRARWALAEAGRRGRAILAEPKAPSPGWWPVHGQFMGLAEARERLAKAGAKMPGRLAALAGLEPEAVELAAGLIEQGAAEVEIERAMREAADPGAAVARMGGAKEGGPALRASGMEGAHEDATEARLRRGASAASAWEELGEAAIKAGDPEVAVRWAMRAVALAEESASTCLLAGRALSWHGDYKAAERYFNLANQRAAQDDPLTTDILDELAKNLVREGRYDEAEPALKEALSRREKALGPEHPDVAQSLRSLAHLRREQGRYKEAEALLRRALVIGDKDASSTHLISLLVLSDLAFVLVSLGEYETAEALLRRSIGVLEDLLGPEHPNVAALLGVLATAVTEQGRYAEAEELLHRALAIQRKSLGVNHPGVGASLQALANALLAQGKYAEAEEQARHALVVVEGGLGAEHPDFASALQKLATALLRQGRLAEAEALLRRALDILERALGSRTPDLCAILISLAGAIAQQDRAEEGEPFALRALEIARQTLGKHPNTSNALYTLAYIQWRAGNPAAAETAREALDSYCHTLGATSPRTRGAASLLFSIGLSTWLQKDLEAFQAGDVLAIGRLSSLVDTTEQLEAPTAEMAARGVLARVLAAVGQRQEALPHARRALELARKAGQQEAAEQLHKLVDSLTTRDSDSSASVGS